MEKSNRNPAALDDRQKEKGDDFEVFLKSGLKSSQVENILKSQGKSDQEIKSFMDRYETSKKN